MSQAEVHAAIKRSLAAGLLYKSVSTAARSDPALYELLVLVDAIRGGRAREHAFVWDFWEDVPQVC